MAPQWKFWLQSYRSGAAYINANLFQYFKEGEKEFTHRKARAYRENHTKRVVDLINSYLFKEPATRKTTNSQLLKFHSDITGRGKTIAQFMKLASQWASVLGRVYIMMDKMALPQEKRTGTQADNLNPLARPYVYTIFPQDVLDLALDENEMIRWVLIREYDR